MSSDEQIDAAHFSEVLPLTWSLEAVPLAKFTDCVNLLCTGNGTPAERIVAGSLVALFGDERAPAIPTLCRVPGGTVLRGTPVEAVDQVVAEWRHVGVERSWILKEAPQSRVDVSDFWLGTYPVTNAQYAQFLFHSESSTERPSSWLLGAYPWDRSNHPVAGVRWEDAQAYCSWLSEQVEGFRFRLPTEAEWEYAARGADRREYPWGDDFDPAATNTREFGLNTTSPIGSFPRGRSWCGAWDLAGNVEEFTSSLYAPYERGEVVDDDLTQILGRYPITRGGSFSRFGDLARCARRHGPHPGKLYPCGFRVAADRVT
ncbi:formylglycine-generating enzyme family protein [Nocardioides rotundus]|uniref:formylglycine-generating enzyme family protein n=1 Tax=Nocardioides rotundus TaxID=1774216 RepID=UPI0037CC8024|nr:formylglycine-generating enzyme family protein [Nocardioides rotundus]